MKAITITCKDSKGAIDLIKGIVDYIENIVDEDLCLFIERKNTNRIITRNIK